MRPTRGPSRGRRPRSGRSSVGAGQGLTGKGRTVTDVGSPTEESVPAMRSLALRQELSEWAQERGLGPIRIDQDEQQGHLRWSRA